jgi:hypothetical protein
VRACTAQEEGAAGPPPPGGPSLAFLAGHALGEWPQPAADVARPTPHDFAANGEEGGATAEGQEAGDGEGAGTQSQRAMRKSWERRQQELRGGGGQMLGYDPSHYQRQMHFVDAQTDRERRCAGRRAVSV